MITQQQLRARLIRQGVNDARQSMTITTLRDALVGAEPAQRQRLIGLLSSRDNSGAGSLLSNMVDQHLVPGVTVSVDEKLSDGSFSTAEVLDLLGG